jgi:cytochrome c
LENHFKLLAVAAIAVLISGCGEKPEGSKSEKESTPLLTAATLGEQTVLAVSEYQSAVPYSTADLSKGASLAQVCRACHSFNDAGANMIGPALFGFFGSHAGSREGFEYSPTMKDAKFVWTPRALDAWLAQPGRFLPGNRMTFAGVSRREERVDLIAYLLEATTGGDK